MQFDTQLRLENERAVLEPLSEMDFDDLYEVASDPKIWEQHPNKDRWKKEVFRNFFEGALQSKGAYKIIDKSNGKIGGSTRFYEPDEKNGYVHVGYTFYATRYWGTGINLSVKALMLDYLFQFVPEVRFHIGAENKRSQIAISRLGAKKIGEQDIAYHGEPTKLNFVYSIKKEDWTK